MSTTIATPSRIALTAAASPRVQYGRAFLGLFIRDLHVLRREIMPFIVRIIMNPLLFLFVFTYIMPHMSNGAAMNPTAGMAASSGANFSTVLLPGLMAVAIMFSGIAAVALPLAVDFGSTREIDDRVMCPLRRPWSASTRHGPSPSSASSPTAWSTSGCPSPSAGSPTCRCRSIPSPPGAVAGTGGAEWEITLGEQRRAAAASMPSTVGTPKRRPVSTSDPGAPSDAEPGHRPPPVTIGPMTRSLGRDAYPVGCQVGGAA